MKKFILQNLLPLFFLPYFSILIFAQSGGILSPEQAAYDVKYYDLNLNIDPALKSISGSVLCRAEIIEPVSNFELDLTNNYKIDSVIISINDSGFAKANFTHSGGKITAAIPTQVSKGNIISVNVFYSGTPRVSLNPPWDVGFVWEKSFSGKDWIGVACEEEGADIWWPCKDHPSDEPDSMSLSFTVPDPLFCASNGKFTEKIENGNNTSTYNWFVSTPINNYNVTFYAAEFELIEDKYQSISGKAIPFYFWVLPEYFETAKNYMNVFKQEFDFLESICGPFPFGDDKHGWAHAPYWGMEHQTIIAYGHNFTKNQWGYDYIHFHELAHEWWGNLITAKDWADVWIHEGIATYTEALYVEQISGKQKYRDFMRIKFPNNNSSLPLAPREPVTAETAFNALNPYYRGAVVLHTLRFHLGDETFFKVLKHWAYNDSTDYDNTSGKLCKLYTTDDMMQIAEEVSGIELDDFFEVFFRQAKFPVLKVNREATQAKFTWSTANNIQLNLDVPIVVNGVKQKVEMLNGEGTITISSSDNLVIDPESWILMSRPVITSVNETEQIFEYKLDQNYPNPFNPETAISYQLSAVSKVELKIFDVLGKEVQTLVNEIQSAGNYKINFDAADLPSGTYFYKLQTGDFTEVKKMTLIK